MNKTEGLPFRTFVPLLVANLEDADPMVRETAKTAVVELFRCVLDKLVHVGRNTDLTTGALQNTP